MCYILYKNKQPSSPGEKDVDNQCGSQLYDVNPLTINPSYSEHIPAALSSADECHHIVYMKIIFMHVD